MLMPSAKKERSMLLDTMGLRMAAEQLMQRKKRDQAEAAPPRFLQDAEDEPGQRALVAQERDPARARGERDHAVGETQGEENDPAIADKEDHFLAQITGEHNEARIGHHEETEGVHVDDRVVKRRAGQQRYEEIKGMPGKARRIPQTVVITAEKVLGNGGRLAVQEMMTHLAKKRKRAVQIVVRQKEIRPPPFQHGEDQSRDQQALRHHHRHPGLSGQHLRFGISHAAVLRIRRARVEDVEARGGFAKATHCRPGGHRLGSFFPAVRRTPPQLFALPAADRAHIMRQAAVDLEQLRGKSLFLTGGTGFFGKWLLGALAHADAELGLDLRVTVLSRDPAAFLQRHPEVKDVGAIQFVSGDVNDFSFTGQRYDFILHAAADTTAFTNAVEEQRRSHAIVSGMERMLELARNCGARRLLNVSSGAVYGACSAKLTGAKEGEEINARPLTPYAEAKQQAERLCENSGVDFVTARAFAFLGPYLALDGHFAAGNFLRDALKGGPILVRGDGTALRSYLHPADLVPWLLRILVAGRSARAYNVGSDESVTTAQLAHRIAEALSPASEVVVQSVQPQGPQNIYLPNLERTRSELDLKITLPLKEAIARTLAFLK